MSISPFDRAMAMYRVVLACLAFVVAPVLGWAGCAPIAFGPGQLEPGQLGPGRSGPARVWPAAGADETVRIRFLGHASFEIGSPGGVRAVTDYNGYNVPDAPPDIATMNHAHSTHYTLRPDPRIAHVLHGWGANGEMPVIDLTVGDMHVTNLPTNIRAPDSATERYGNSVFVFETGGLCIAHLSHLHHRLQPEDITALGHVDVVMVAVDGIWTMSQADAAAVVDQLQPRIVLPMHYFTRDVLDQFLALERGKYAVDVRDSPLLELSRDTLPGATTVIALPGGY